MIEKRARRWDDEDAGGQSPRHQLGQHESRLDRLAKTHAVGEEQPDATHPDRAEHRYKLVGLNPKPAGLGDQERVRAEGLLEQERLVIDEPVAERRRAVGAKIVNNGLDLLEGVEQVKLATGTRALA